MFLVVCSDLTESDGATFNTAFLLGRDGQEIGRYHKVCPTWSEAGARQRGNSFPVFPTPDLGTAGMLICYDLVIPETARCLALAGAASPRGRELYLAGCCPSWQRRDDHFTARENCRPGGRPGWTGHCRH